MARILLTAEQIAKALTNTAETYRKGLMSHGTFKSHMGSLWARADADGVKLAVIALTDPWKSLPVGGAPR